MEFYTEFTILFLVNVSFLLTDMFKNQVIVNNIGYLFTLGLVQYLVV